MKKFVFIFFILIVLSESYAQSVQGCEQIFKATTNKVKSIRSLSANKGFSLNCRIVVTPFTGNVVTEKMEVRSSNKKYYYATSATTLYQDDASLVVIQKDQREIFITRPAAENARKNQFSEMIKLQDSLQKYLDLKSCLKESGTIDKGKTYLKLTFELKSEIKVEGLNSIVYWIDSEKKEVRKMMINYQQSETQNVKSYEMFIDQMNNDYSSTVFDGTALSMVMQENKIKPVYRSFEIIDKR